MSKHIWRVVQQSDHDEQDRPFGGVPNATVIHDHACIPIKELLAVVKATEAWYNCEDFDSELMGKLQTQMCVAMGKYHVAEERMQLKRQRTKK